MFKKEKWPIKVCIFSIDSRLVCNDLKHSHLFHTWISLAEVHCTWHVKASIYFKLILDYRYLGSSQHVSIVAHVTNSRQPSGLDDSWVHWRGPNTLLDTKTWENNKVSSQTRSTNPLWSVHCWLPRWVLVPFENDTLLVIDGCLEFVRFMKKPHMTYIVHKLAMEWSSCNFVFAQWGYICKHCVKVLQLLNPSLVVGTIVADCKELL